MAPPDWANITADCLGPNQHGDSIAAVSLRKPHNPRKRKVRGKAGFLVDSDDDEPAQETFRKILSLFPPSSTLEKRRLKARNPFLLSPSPPPAETRDGTHHTSEDGEEALDIPFPQGSDSSDPNPSLLPDPNFKQTAEENHETARKQTKSSEGSSDITQATTLEGALVVQQPSCQPTCTDSNVSIYGETQQSQTSNDQGLVGLGLTTSSEESGADTHQVSQSPSTNTTVSCTHDDTERSHGSRVFGHFATCATEQSSKKRATEHKHVSFAEEETVIPPLALEDPRSPSEESLASLFGDDDTDFDKVLGLGSCASPGSARAVDSVGNGTPEPNYPQIAVEWKTPEFDYFNPYPVWSGEPSTDAVIATLKAAHDPQLHYAVEPLWDGQYNRFYTVTFGGAAYVLKATLPVCPGHKTASEVATVRWTREETCLPVPTVAAAANDDDDGLYSASAANPLGCEWILFGRVPGRPLSACWRTTEFGVKQRVVVQLAAYAAAVWDRRFDAIGNLYPGAPTANALDTRSRPGAMVSPHLFWNGRSERFGAATGPFATYREWAFERLDLVAREAFARLPQIVDRRLRAVPWRICAVVARLRVLHDRLFPPGQGQGRPGEPTMLWHDDLSADNLLVDDDGVLTGVLGWDSVSCTPRSLCDLPALLQDSPDRAAPPDLVRHWDFAAAGAHAPRASYWPRLREHEITELRAIFLAEMRWRSLEWTMTYRYNGLRRDFEAAVQNCDHPLMLHVVENWLDAVEKGLLAGKHPKNLEVWSLQERCVQGIRNKD